MNAVVDRNRVAPLPEAGRSTAKTGTQPRLASSASPLHPSLVAALDPSGAEAEALRELRSQLILRWFGEQRALAVIGARAADGADTVAANVAISLAQLGEPTLLIDANLRAPRLHDLFGLQPAAGLSDLLRNRDVHDAAIVPVPAVDSLHVLCAGQVPSNPQELVSRTPFMYLMKTLPDRFRALVIATPPALAYADAQVIAARAGGCLLVTRRHRTRIADVARVKDQLVPAKATLVGGVLRG
jgi:chain length determinant protein tyrosine kinase EpsG